MKRTFAIVMNSFIILVMLAGCSPTAFPAGNGNPPSNTQNYQVEIINLTEPVYETIRTESIDQPNCNGTGEVDNVVERTMGINHSIEVGLGLTVDVDGKLELFGTGVDLGAAISSELGYQYGITESISRSITVRAAPKTHVVHTVKLSEVWESGTARVTTNGQSIDIPFRFRANFSIDLLESVPVDCATGQAIATQSASQPTLVGGAEVKPSATSISAPSIIQGDGPFREHRTVSVGSGIFTQVTSSDGNASYSQTELDTNHFRIYRIRPEENPDGCGVSIYNAEKVWFSSSTYTTFTVNGQEIGKLSVSTGRHGFVADWTVKVGDYICAVGYASSGFHIIFGPDMYYHYDSYCYRGNC